jgi:hypothetical protein
MCKGEWKCYLSQRMQKVAHLWSNMALLKCRKQRLRRSLMLLLR